MTFVKCVTIAAMMMMTPLAANAAEPEKGKVYCKPELNFVDRVACAHHVAMWIVSQNKAERLRKKAEDEQKAADYHAEIVRKRYVD